MAVIGSFIAAHAVAITIASTVASVAASVAGAAIQAQQQNAQIEYQKRVQQENIKAAQNKAAAEAKMRRTQAMKANAAARAKMAATGVDAASGSFLDLVGQGAAHGEMDVLKAQFDGDAEAWALNTKINELETQKQNVGLAAGLAGVGALADSVSKYNFSSFGGANGTPTSGQAISANGGNPAGTGGAGYSGTLPTIGTGVKP